MPFVVCLRRAQPGAGPHPRSETSGRAGRIAGRPQPGLRCQKPGAPPQRGAPADRADPELHSRPPAAQRPDRPQRQSGPGAGLAGSSAGRQPGLPLCRGGEPALVHRRPAAGCLGLPAPLPGSHCGTGCHPGREPFPLPHSGAGKQLLQPAGLHRAPGAQAFQRQTMAGCQPVFRLGLEPGRPGPAGGRRPAGF